jgi:hypothetical protein
LDENYERATAKSLLRLVLKKMVGRIIIWGLLFGLWLTISLQPQPTNPQPTRSKHHQTTPPTARKIRIWLMEIWLMAIWLEDLKRNIRFCLRMIRVYIRQTMQEQRRAAAVFLMAMAMGMGMGMERRGATHLDCSGTRWMC